MIGVEVDVEIEAVRVDSFWDWGGARVGLAVDIEIGLVLGLELVFGLGLRLVLILGLRLELEL